MQRKSGATQKPATAICTPKPFVLKRLYIDVEKTRYVRVYIFDSVMEMRAEYRRRAPHDTDHDRIEGVHLAYHSYIIPKKMRGKKITPSVARTFKRAAETGTILLHTGRLGAGVVTHEIMHAVLWGECREKKSQYPIVIKSMREEERILHNHTAAVMRFYEWYWRRVEPVQKQRARRK